MDSHIRIREDDFPEDAAEVIASTLTLNNVAREEALRAGRHDEAAEMDELILMFEVTEDGWVVLPRGFASHLFHALERFGVGIDVQDNRTRASDFSVPHSIPLFDYQEKIYDGVLEAEQGIVEAPTGSGKTVAALAVIGTLDGPSIVIVNTKEIADQWMTRCADWLGDDFPCGLVGDGEFWEAPAEGQSLTVAINATLWSRREELTHAGFFENFILACMDECHHANAETYKHVFSSFTSQFRFGMSATPEKTGDERIPYIVLGPEIIEITEEDVSDKILKPTIEVVETKFRATFKGSNYSKVVAKLVRDHFRNNQIAHEIVSRHRDNANLVLSKQMKHFELIWDALVDHGYPADQIFTIIGDDSREERREIVKRTEEAHCVILSTLADEALDAPRLDRLHLAFPTSNPDLVRQQIGRIRRRHPEKADAVVIDYRDVNVRVFDKQYMTRRHEVYDPLDFKVVKRREQ